MLVVVVCLSSACKAADDWRVYSYSGRGGSRDARRGGGCSGGAMLADGSPPDIALTTDRLAPAVLVRNGTYFY